MLQAIAASAAAMFKRANIRELSEIAILGSQRIIDRPLWLKDIPDVTGW